MIPHLRDRLRTGFGVRYLLIVLMLLPLWAVSLQGQSDQPGTQTRKDKSSHNPKLDSAIEQLIGLTAAGNAAGAQQLASQLGLQLIGNTVTVTLEVNGGDAVSTSALAGMVKPLVGNVWSSRSFLKTRLPLVAVGVLNQIAGMTGIRFIRPPYTPQTLAISEGVELTGASAYHRNGFRGQGVKIAVIDLGFSGASLAQSRGELPANMTKMDYSGAGVETGTSHGTAVAEIIYDMAPQAELILMKVGDEVDLENAKDDAIRLGARIINHSVGWFNTNFYDGTGTIDQIANDARAQGVLWVNAAGNYARRHWQGQFTDGNGNTWHEFSSGDESINVSAQVGDLIQVFMTWNDWPASSADYDLYLFDNSGNQVASSERIQSGTERPTEALVYRAPFAGTYHIKVRADGTIASKTLAIFNLNQDIEHAVASRSIVAPADAAQVMTVGAINWQAWSTGPAAPYSSQGPTNAGLAKPDIAAPDRINTSTVGEFPGTSAAAPHVAGAAALLLAENPSMSAGALAEALKSSAINMGSPLALGRGRLNLAPAVVLRPDLIPLSLDWTPRPPRVGDAVVFTLAVKNQGNANAGAFTVELRSSSGTDRQTLTSLAAGASASVNFNRRLSATSETFTAVIDPMNQVDESNETNNTLQQRVDALAPNRQPDLIVGSIDFSPRTLQVGDTVTLSVVVRNQGQGDAGAFAVDVTDSAGTTRRNLPGLAAASSTNFEISRRINSTAETFAVVVDPQNQVAESDENNNRGQIRVEAQPASPPPPPPPPPSPQLSVSVQTEKTNYRIGENLRLTLTVNARSYIYLIDVNPSGQLSLIFPNALARSNRLEAGTHTLPNGSWNLVVSGPEGTEFIFAVASSEPVDLPLELGHNLRLTTADQIRSFLTGLLQLTSTNWALGYTSFRISSSAGGTPPPQPPQPPQPPHPPPSPDLLTSISVNKGCGPGGSPYRLGEPIVITYRVAADASVTIHDFAPATRSSGVIQTVISTTARAGETRTFTATVTGAPGVETIVLRGVTSHGKVLAAACSFSVEGLSPGAARLSTQKGCETTFVPGEGVIISYQVDLPVTRVRIYVIGPTGLAELTSVPLSQRTGTLTGLPPVSSALGDRVLVLVAFTGEGMLSATCRYSVGA